jgi:8-oxo-dGTP pyrophosphatase MutT (NUDIX family)
MNKRAHIQNAGGTTAGAYVDLDGLYPFAIGSKLHDGNIPVIRLGGHREENETGWQCAAREVYEEASLHIEPLFPRTTYLANWDQLETELEEIQWQPKTEQEPAPILVVTYRRENVTSLSLMYLAHAEGHPRPSSEVKGILLLEKEEIHRLCQKPMTLEQYLRGGGRAILNDKFNTKLLLEPFAQLRLLSRILSIQSQNRAAANTNHSLPRLF